MELSRKMQIFTLLCFSISIVGCASSHVTFQTSQSHVMRNAQQSEHVTGIKFESSVMAKGLSGQQLIYQVTLQDKSGRPLRSHDGRYQNSAGQVAAARSFFVHYPLQTFNDLNVTIPADQFEVRHNHLPVTANVGIYTVSGESLANTQYALPSAKLLATP